jgi:hydroxyethylthiazole kinase-like uncharacterized protein yjeF
MTLPEILSCEAMRAAEGRAMAAGTPSPRLMERAGRAVADAISARYATATRVAVLAGPGNNGGDGFVVARVLAGRGHAVTVFAGALPKRGGDAARMAKQWQGARAPADGDALRRFAPDLIVDALFGIGLSRAPEGGMRALIEAANALREGGAALVTVDIPSGYAGDDGQAPGVAISADVTVTFHALKPAHVLQPGREACGEIVVADIGIEAVAVPPCIAVNGRPAWLDGKAATSAHKYDHGHALVMSGGLEGSGAARLAARAALRAGAGLVTLGVPASALIAHAGREPDALMVRRADGEGGLAGLLADKRRNAVVIGPAYGVGEATRVAVATVLRAGRGTVLDADALASFAGQAPQLGALIRASVADVAATPHAGEFANLFKAMDADVESLNQGLRSTSKIVRALAAAEFLGAAVV